MRTTVAIDDDVFLLAQQTAQRDRVSLGKAISKLVRQGLQQQPGMAGRAPVVFKSKYSVFPVRDEVITSEHVYKLMEQEGL
jgi:hypothetical protein